MNAGRVQFLRAAREELRRAVRYYDEQTPGLGDEFTAEVERSIRQIVAYPELGSSYLAGTRRVLVQRFPFRIVYKVQGAQIMVLAVVHYKRKPDYWLGRS